MRWLRETRNQEKEIYYYKAISDSVFTGLPVKIITLHVSSVTNCVSTHQNKTRGNDISESEINTKSTRKNNAQCYLVTSQNSKRNPRKNGSTRSPNHYHKTKMAMGRSLRANE